MNRAKLSRVDTLYIYERLWVALDCEGPDEMCRELSELMAELATNYHADTGRRIGEDLGQYVMEAANWRDTIKRAFNDRP